MIRMKQKPWMHFSAFNTAAIIDDKAFMKGLWKNQNNQKRILFAVLSSPVDVLCVLTTTNQGKGVNSLVAIFI